MGFESAFFKTMHREGWGKESNHKADPGKYTFSGISQPYWPEWEGWIILRAWRADPTNEALLRDLMFSVERFYRINFWNRISGDLLDGLSPDIAEEVFDTCVNVGLERGAGYLQEALNLLNRNQLLYKDLLVDGAIGPKTINTLGLALSQRPPTKAETEARILRIINVLHGSLWVTNMRKHPEREEFRGIWDRV